MKPVTILAAALLLVASAAAAAPGEAATPAQAPEVAAQPAAEPPRPVAARRRARPPEAIPEPPPPAPPLPGAQSAAINRWGEPAPIPNRDIEAPRDRFAGPLRPTLEPVIIDERELNRGFTFGREHLSSRQEVLGKDLAPGARIRIPLD
jgi:hypothetical protein